MGLGGWGGGVGGVRALGHRLRIIMETAAWQDGRRAMTQTSEMKDSIVSA